MIAPFTIRIATAADVESLCQLWKSVDDLHRAALPALFQTPSAVWPAPEIVEALIAGPDSAISVAKGEGAVIGFVTRLLHRRAETPIRPARILLEIDNMAVDPAQRRRGVGQALMAAAKDWAKGQSADGMDLNLYAFNHPAARLYEKCGFTPALHRLTKEI